MRARAQHWASVCLLFLTAALLSVFVSPLSPGPAGAQANDTPSAAIARLNYVEHRRRGHCTAFAIAPKIAVTASHCLRLGRPAQVHILFGFNRMEWATHIEVDAFRDLGNDISLVMLDVAAPSVLTVARAPTADQSATSVGYGQPGDQVQKTLDCFVEHVLRRHVRLDCPASPGHSGAPVMDEEGRVFGVMVQTGAASSIAALFPSDLVELIAGQE